MVEFCLRIESFTKLFMQVVFLMIFRHTHTHTWKTVSRAWGKLSKLLRFLCTPSKLNLPPNTCIPSRAKMMMKRKSRSSREAMDFMEFSSDATRLLRDAQWLHRHGREKQHNRVNYWRIAVGISHLTGCYHFHSNSSFRAGPPQNPSLITCMAGVSSVTEVLSHLWDRRFTCLGGFSVIRRAVFFVLISRER